MSTEYTTDSPSAGELICVDWGDVIGVVPADVWLWTTGDGWTASIHPEIATWWEGTPDDERVAAGCPDEWYRPIFDVPTTGTLRWVRSTDLAGVAENARVMFAHLAALAVRRPSELDDERVPVVSCST